MGQGRKAAAQAHWRGQGLKYPAIVRCNVSISSKRRAVRAGCCGSAVQERENPKHSEWEHAKKPPPSPTHPTTAGQRVARFDLKPDLKTLMSMVFPAALLAARDELKDVAARAGVGRKVGEAG